MASGDLLDGEEGRGARAGDAGDLFFLPEMVDGLDCGGRGTSHRIHYMHD